MIDREDLMELTRRMTVKRTSIDRIAGAYIDSTGIIDGSFNVSFAGRDPSEKAHFLKIAKEVIYSDTNRDVQEYCFPESARRPGSVWQLLMGMNSCGLKNDALLDTFYEIVSENYSSDRDYAVIFFHDNYDIPIKTRDHQRTGESEDMYSYLICAVCPQVKQYEPGRPLWGFLFPMFSDRSGDPEHMAVFSPEGPSSLPCEPVWKVMGCKR